MATECFTKSFHDRWTKVLNACLAMQLTHCGGKYSIERTLALDEYIQNTSLLHVVLVAFTPPVFMLTVVVCQESIPLQDPTAGWKANYGFWVRVEILGVAIGCLVSSQFKAWLGVPGLSARQLPTFCIGIGACLIMSGMVVSEIWVFPVPFFSYTISIALVTALLGLLRIVIGANGLRDIISRREQLHRLKKVSILLGFMILAYPGFQMLFNKANHTRYELLVLLLLSVFKIITKKGFARVASHNEDMIPEQVVLTVDYFDALYLATFMPSLTTTSLVSVLVLDLIQAGVELRELHQQTRGILTRFRRNRLFVDNAESSHSLLTAVQIVCRHLETGHRLSNRRIKVRSCIPHHLSGLSMAQLNRLGGSTLHRLHYGGGVSLSSILPQEIPGQARTIQLNLPASAMTDHQQNLHVYEEENLRCASSVGDSSDILEEALKALFTSECLILAEYLEFMIPSFYGSFVLVMVHLPSAQYHSEMIEVNKQNVGSTVSWMFIHALLEFASFLGLSVIMSRNCGIHALYQLAFVLETQISLVLSKLVLWMLLTLTYRVLHFGVDFSFRFVWIASEIKP